MYNPYGPPPMMWGYPPNMPQPNDDQYKRGMIFAMKLAAREEREKEKKKFKEKKEREETSKKFHDARRRLLIAVELYIFGILSQPFMLYAYNQLLTNYK